MYEGEQDIEDHKGDEDNKSSGDDVPEERGSGENDGGDEDGGVESESSFGLRGMS